MNIFEALATNPAFNDAMLPPSMPNAGQGSDCEKVEKAGEPVPPLPSEGIRFGCATCGRHDTAGIWHWCFDRQARKFRNIAFIKACPLNGHSIQARRLKCL